PAFEAMAGAIRRRAQACRGRRARTTVAALDGRRTSHMYERFFGLTERPFDLTPNPRFLYLTGRHREALCNLRYGIEGRKGVTLLIGDAGTGKTTLLRAALEEQQSRPIRTVTVSNPALTRAEFFEFLASSFGLSPNAANSKSRFLFELTR